jgi:DNA-binding NarL/FixJ family response regulator
MEYNFLLDPQVVVQASYGREAPSTMTLVEVLDSAARGRLPRDLAACRGSMLTVALSCVKTQKGLLIGYLSDAEGMVPAPLSNWVLPTEMLVEGTTGTVGERLTRALQATKIGQAKDRLAKAKRISGAKEREIVASATAQILLSEERRPSLRSWWIVEVNKRAEARFLVTSPGLADIDAEEPSPDRTRRRIFNAITRAFELDAGTERHEFQGEPVTFESFPEVESASPSAGSPESFVLSDLIEHANLTDREGEILSLYLAEQTDAQIASQLGIAASTVRNTRSRVLEKIKKNL